MSMFRRSFALSLVLCACAAPAAAPQVEPAPQPAPSAGAEPRAATPEEPGVVRFFQRRVDLKPFLSGFPYREFHAQLEDGKLFYLDAREHYTLLVQDIGENTASIDLTRGTPVSNADFSQRSLFNMHYVPQRNQLWVLGDEKNDEQLNLFRIDLNSTDPTPRMPLAETHEDYIYDFGFSKDNRWLGYLARKGKEAPYSTCLKVRDLTAQTVTEREVVCDSEELRFTWGLIQFSADASELYFAAQAHDDRKQQQLVRVDLRKKKPVLEPVTDVRKSRSSLDLLHGTARGDKLVFVANDDGYKNVYLYAPKTRKVTQLTHYTDDIDSAALAPEGVFLSHGTPAGSQVELVSYDDGKAIAEFALPGKLGIFDAHGQTALWTYESPGDVFALNATHFVKSGSTTTLDTRKLAAPDAALEDAIVQCKAEAVRFETFDNDPKTGQKRMLHAFLLTPKRPLSSADGVPAPLGMIRSFYGGDNVYTQLDHILCAAGITVLSPAVRGSDGFGKEFFALNDGDLGGDEIVDLFYAARFLAHKTGMPAEHIGVYGRSHGGYATMRALTFPPATNNRNESYPFGFGLAEAGFSDIEAFWKATNIPDWVVLEAGDPEKPAELAKIRDRSPIHHVDLLHAPIFLLHGEADWRVPVEGSRAFVRAAQALGKPVTYFEVAGQGHHVEGLERIAQTFQVRFDFLQTVLNPPPASGKPQLSK